MSTRAGYVRWHGGACVTTERSFDSLVTPALSGRGGGGEEEKQPFSHSRHPGGRGLVVVRRPAGAETSRDMEQARFPMARTDVAVSNQPVQDLAKRLQSMGAQQAARRLHQVTEERRRLGEQVHVRGHFGAQSRTNVVQPFTFSHAVKTPNGQMVAVVSTATSKLAKGQTNPSSAPSRGPAPTVRKHRPARPVDIMTQPKLVASPREDASSLRQSEMSPLEPPRPLREPRIPSPTEAPHPKPTKSSLTPQTQDPCPGTSMGSITPRPPRSRSPVVRAIHPHLPSLPLARAHSPGRLIMQMSRPRQDSQLLTTGTRNQDSTSRTRPLQSPTYHSPTTNTSPALSRSHKLRQFAVETLGSANASSPRNSHDSRRPDSPSRRFIGARAVSVEHCSFNSARNKRRMPAKTTAQASIRSGGGDSASYRPRILSTGGTYYSSNCHSSQSSDEWDATAASQGNSETRSIGQRLIRVRL